MSDQKASKYYAAEEEQLMKKVSSTYDSDAACGIHAQDAKWRRSCR
jgi:hypothetical protein